MLPLHSFIFLDGPWAGARDCPSNPKENRLRLLGAPNEATSTYTSIDLELNRRAYPEFKIALRQELCKAIQFSGGTEHSRSNRLLM